MRITDPLPPYVKDDYRHKDAVRFMQSAEAQPDVEYKWVFDYAKSLWDYRAKSFSSIEDKAESIIKYLGGGTGLFAIGVLSKIDSGNFHIALSTLPSLMCAMFSLFFAIRSKNPDDVPSLPTVENAKHYADGGRTEQKATAQFLGQWHLACTDMKLTCNRKAWFVEVSTMLFCSAIALLLIPLIVSAGWPPASTAK